MFNINIYTCRRRLLDNLLFHYLSKSTGNLLDIGGKRFNFRGKFSSTNLPCSVSCVNPDCSVLPDYVGELTDFDFPNNYFDIVLCLETLEYVLTPETLLSQFGRSCRLVAFSIYLCLSCTVCMVMNHPICSDLLHHI